MSTSNLRWLTSHGPHILSDGVSFGIPWRRGLYQPGQTFVIEAKGTQWPLDSRELAYWADGSLKWTAHSVSADIGYSDQYTVTGLSHPHGFSPGIEIKQQANSLSVTSPSGLHLWFAAPGSSSILQQLDIDGQIVCSAATVVSSINGEEHTARVDAVKVENSTPRRALIKVSGIVEAGSDSALLPFDVRFYIYSHASSIRIVHSFIHDLDPDKTLTSLGLRFSIPLGQTELYNRHVRLGGSGGGILKEEVKGLSGLRHGPTIQNRIDQTAGRAVTLKASEWARTDLSKGLSFIPSWNSYSLAQLSSDGFTVKKRTKPGCSWVKVPGGGRADGTVYVGTASHGGLAVGMSDFWERYPTQIDLDELTSEEGSITVWLYSPLAEPLETAPYHDGLGLDTYDKQLQALDVTYEDFEPGFASANGIARTNQVFMKPFLHTPSNEEFSAFSSLVRDPPRLVATGVHMHSSGAFHGCWAPDSQTLGLAPTPKQAEIETQLSLLFDFYHRQVEQHRWYGFWDHGDVQHTYDPYRHAWRYDVGGYAWDNSELSTDLWLWLYFLHTGRADVFKMAEAMTRHTGEVDVYHSGNFRGFGTRHGVQHFSDSSKQLRISNVLYRRIYFYLTGDERTGDLISELQDCQNTLLALDSHRKVQEHAGIPAGFAMTNIGLDGGALVTAWLTAWERRSEGWLRYKALLIQFLDGIAGLRHGIGNNAILLNPTTGEVRECPPPTPEYAISHLSMLFGFPEIIAELFHFAREEHPDVVGRFMEVWLAYCRAYNGGPDVQREEFGFEFPSHATWRQSHSTLTAFAAVEQNNEKLAHAAWDQFFHTDGYTDDHDWSFIQASPPEYYCDGVEAPWVTTNEAARYGVSAISNLASIGKFLASAYLSHSYCPRYKSVDDTFVLNSIGLTTESLESRSNIR
ncbi:uncharacterized protein N7482_007093 [Penicillium canariense]|uniref:Tat pathway signal sequence domain protein n=1 Tax=Penicillium canariense TaxID=189055 RepID=A0A9W9HXH1_9EURO|nr:uncharacterized protein N7482_007093 [Penicillium canariense]KAJ5160089.1 hypothetical protein N7482_007093 [Penicillium canariense]